MLKVIKRDGRLKEFDQERIYKAIEKAYEDVYGSEGALLYQPQLLDINEDILESVESIKKERISIEEIQDIVVKVLELHNKKVNKSYQSYREERTRERDLKTKLISEIKGLVNLTNTAVLTENSNKQSQLLSTQRDLIAGEVSKFIALNSMIPKDIIEAHMEGIIKIHDLDYYLQDMFNCSLINLEDMLQNGTVINKKLIEKPKSLRTAMTIATQISAQVASFQYGGQTMSLSHLAPFVRISKEKIINKYTNMKLPITTNKLEELIHKELKEEIKDSVQTFNYQISTLQSTNGQSPFISLAMYISENPEYEEETALLIEEFLYQRINGMKNEYGVTATPTFPKLLYFLDENNTYEGSKYFYLTELAIKSTASRMNPDFISAKKMKEEIGHVFPCMGCRAFLSPAKINGEYEFYGRANLGVTTINLPYIALLSGGKLDKFWEILDEKLELCRRASELRYEKLRNVKASVAPILWQHGAISRLKHDEPVLKAINERAFTVTLGYSGIYETIKSLLGVSHTTDEGFKLSEEIMKHLERKTEIWKQNQPHLKFALYGTPQESSTQWFNDALVRKFGKVKDITDKGFITNSYHVDVREKINAFDKLSFESELQKYSKGGAVSYVETHNMQNNHKALLKLVQYMYETIRYAEINFESDVCGKCGFTGVIENDSKTLDWVCPQCGNREQETLSVVRRVCGLI